MKINLKLTAILSCLVFIVQCTDQKISPDAIEIGLETENENAFSGSLLVDSNKVTYASIADSELVFDIAIEINGKKLNASINYENENLEIDGHNAVLQENEKIALLETGRKLSEYILDHTEKKLNMTQYSLLRFLEYWGKSPTGYVYSKLSLQSETNTSNIKSRNDGITCIRKNTYVNAQYDDANGNNRRDRVKVGSKARNGYECMGRCGSGCGRWWIPSAWTKDCMDHDQCSNVFRASGGGGDRNCGDEFNEAADDYIFGVSRGCRG